MGKLCICKCERKPLWYGADEDEAPVIGVLVKLEGNPSDDCCWITTSEFMELVLKKGKEAGG